MKGVSDIKLIQYQVLKTFFELNTEFQFSSKKIEINPDFNRKIQKIDDNKFQIKLCVKITKEKHLHSIPFYAEVIISAMFELDQWEKEAFKIIAVDNATAIMFPFLRTLLSTITLNGNIPPYTLPIMNINKLFMDDNI